MSIDGMKERTILLDGFSKTYAMTGWRMGYGVMRADLATHISRLMTNSNSCTATFTQVAGIEALRGSQDVVDDMRAKFKERRDVMVAGLNKIKGFSCRVPHGAFYVFPNITKTGWRSKKLADALLEDAGVAALSGTAFGDFGAGLRRPPVTPRSGGRLPGRSRIAVSSSRHAEPLHSFAQSASILGLITSASPIVRASVSPGHMLS